MPDTPKPHWTFWVIGLFGLFWHIGTVMNFFSQLSPEGIANLPERYRVIVEARPVWSTAALALAGFGGLIGCLLLLFRRRLAIPFLWASLAGVALQIIPALSLASGPVFAVFSMSLVVICVLIWYARRADELERLL